MGLTRGGAPAAPSGARGAGVTARSPEYATHRITYGTEPSQFAELRVPAGSGPHPVVVLIHGGCWKRDFGSLRDLGPMADSLAASGVATWNVEYRRVGEPGGGWPGTFSDIAASLDHLGTLAPAYRLDLVRVVIVGHSAGGTLGLWAAARDQFEKTRGGGADAIRPRLRGVVSLAGLTDLEQRARTSGQGRCSEGAVESLLAGSPADVPDRYARVSPIRLLPLGVPHVHLWGREDALIPSQYGTAMVEAASKAGDMARLVIVEGAGHFELARPLPPAWPAVRASIQSLLGSP